MATTSMSLAPERAVKQLLLVRHGQGTHNESGVDKNPQSATEEDRQRLVDARLTEHGKHQARMLREHLKAEMSSPPELVVTSPLTRTIETALEAFDGPGARLVAVESCREALGGVNTWDKRSSKSYLQHKFPQVDFANVFHEEDVQFEKYADRREQLSERIERAGTFLEWLRHRKERKIAVVSHAGFLGALLNGYFIHTLDQKAAEALVATLGNCEVRPVAMVDNEAPVIEDPLAWSPRQSAPAKDEREEMEKQQLRGF